ncbi:MAG: 16S rRNA (cytosine(1402)-N(4))-methyltransferase RsmH [Gammaproteobacteria bacterium]|nr:16S rRNA (cytosine(1402)-N(4))-methyltransferase RsmH [Gammaproteobacteria bacterium]
MTGDHAPVLLAEAIEALAITPDGRYIDATFGRGGHSAAILARLSPRGRLLVIDRDESAIAAALKGIGADSRVTAVKGRFSMMENIQANAGWTGHVDGVLFDLGVSSPQLDEPERGFSFRALGPLDMRMERDRGEPASAWLERADETEIAQVLRDLGEERFAKRIARAIVRARHEAPITTTRALADLIVHTVPRTEPGQHPATRSFQAIRIHVNDELGELAAALPVALRLLRPGGRLVVISFHSLEDRCVKRFFQEEARGDPHPPRLPVLAHTVHPRLRLVGRAQRPTADEIARNPRARSAVLRVAECLGGAHE